MSRRFKNIQFWKPRIHQGIARGMSSIQIFHALNYLAVDESKISLDV
jgi:hypothetical protein